MALPSRNPSSTWKILLQQLRTPLGTIVEAGEIDSSSGGMVRYRKLQRYAFILIKRGEGQYDDELGRSRNLTAGDWIMVLPELGHTYGPWRRGGWDEIYCMFEGPIFDAWASAGLLHTELVTGHLDQAPDWLQRLLQEVVYSEKPPLERICAFQTLLAIALQSSTRPGSQSEVGPPWFHEACRQLAQPGAKARLVAQDLRVPYETFRRHFKQHAGVSPHRYHLGQILNQASRLLDRTDLKSAEIARSLGFCDEAHFSRTFKKTKGRSPRTYRTSRNPQ